MINYKLAKERGLTQGNIDKLEDLHEEMDWLAADWNRSLAFPFRKPRPVRKWTSRYVESLEYQMQDRWGFDRDKSKHTHWRRFPGLRPKRELLRVVSVLSTQEALASGIVITEEAKR